mgnify:CR=1 FL=1
MHSTIIIISGFYFFHSSSSYNLSMIIDPSMNEPLNRPHTHIILLSWPHLYIKNYLHTNTNWMNQTNKQTSIACIVIIIIFNVHSIEASDMLSSYFDWVILKNKKKESKHFLLKSAKYRIYFFLRVDRPWWLLLVSY